MELKFIKSLLSEVSEIQRRLSIRFNVFDIADVRHYETRHSAILAGILQWEGSRKPLDFFLKRVFNQIDLSEKQLADLSVSTECWIDVKDEKRRLDILIRSKDICVVIENKIFTEDHTNQLDAYKEWMDKQNCSYCRLVYLTLKGTESSEGFSEEQYVRISWRTDIRDFLVYCSSLTNIDLRFNSTALQYAEFWENWFMATNGISDLILSSKENYLAAQGIFHAFTEAKYKLIKNTLKNWQNNIKELPVDKDCNVDKLNGEACEKILFKWNAKYRIGFEFGGSNFSKLLYGVIGDGEVSNRTPFNGWEASSWWPAYKKIQNKEISELGENSEICLSNIQEIYQVLNSAFNEIIDFVQNHPESFAAKNSQ